MDESHFVGWQLNRMPRPFRDRLFVHVSLIDKDNLMFTTRDATASHSLVKDACSGSAFLKQKTGRFSLGIVHTYSFRFSKDEGGGCRVACCIRNDPRKNSERGGQFGRGGGGTSKGVSPLPSSHPRRCTPSAFYTVTVFFAGSEASVELSIPWPCFPKWGC